ncbi:MAG: hypothetical protein ACRCSV_02515 [Chlamydiales bacterium]
MMYYLNKYARHIVVLLLLSLSLTSCSKSQKIITGVTEREANIIVVFLEARGIRSNKVRVSGGSTTAAEQLAKFDITVKKNQSIQAMALLNQNGFPKQRYITLLQLFQASGFMTSEREENIRYQAGLAEQINNMITMIDGVIDSNVQLSFPTTETTAIGANTTGTQEKQRITAAVYVKHQGVLDDPNNYLEDKIKRLVSGSITGLNINDVTVVSDRSRFTDILPYEREDRLTSYPKEMVSIWSIIMNRESALRFRILFLILISVSTLLLLLFGWTIWKIYPIFKQKHGVRKLFSLKPFTNLLNDNSVAPAPIEEEI